jgi:hypothetical protein
MVYIMGCMWLCLYERSITLGIFETNGVPCNTIVFYVKMFNCISSKPYHSRLGSFFKGLHFTNFMFVISSSIQIGLASQALALKNYRSAS